MTFTPIRNYDLIFIDNNFRYTKMKECFDKFCDYSNKVIALHDICDTRYGAKQLWKNVKQNKFYKTTEYIYSGAGIGVVWLDKNY